MKKQKEKKTKQVAIRDLKAKKPAGVKGGRAIKRTEEFPFLVTK